MFSELSAEDALAGLKEFLADPTGNVQVLVMSIAVLVLLVLVVALFVLYMLMRPQRRMVRTRHYDVRPDDTRLPGAGTDDPAAAATTAAPRRPLAFLGSGIGIALIALLAFTAVYAATSTDSYCFYACHEISPFIIQARENAHASCASCHQRSGLVGVLPNTVSRLRMAAVALVGQEQPESLPVDSRQCLHCHGDVLKATAVSDNGTIISHKEIVEAGEPCTVCHIGAGHSADTYRQGMEPCVVCHDAITASADCTTCHSARAITLDSAEATTTERVSSGGYRYALVDASRPYCDGCHDVANQCDPCHGGIRMPHDDDFINGGHAKVAAFEAKAVCWKCHTPEESCSSPCHHGFLRTGITGHPPIWKSEHAKAPPDSPCGCHQRYSRRTGPMCPICH